LGDVSADAVAPSRLPPSIAVLVAGGEHGLVARRYVDAWLRQVVNLMKGV
jgi:hypothetical protein